MRRWCYLGPDSSQSHRHPIDGARAGGSRRAHASLSGRLMPSGASWLRPSEEERPLSPSYPSCMLLGVLGAVGATQGVQLFHDFCAMTGASRRVCSPCPLSGVRRLGCVRALLDMVGPCLGGANVASGSRRCHASPPWRLRRRIAHCACPAQCAQDPGPLRHCRPIHDGDVRGHH